MSNNYLKCDMFEVDKNKNYGLFDISDMIDLCYEHDVNNKLVYILSFIVSKESRGHGYGTKELKELIAKQGEDRIILTTACVLFEEYPVEPSSSELINIVNKVSNYLEKLGFVEINKLSGYESKVSYVYGNEAGKKIANIINKNM